MKTPHTAQTRPPSVTADDVRAPDTWYRSGAVARLLQMPVATLRIWERRYGLTHNAPSPGGHRLYSANDLRRLALLKQLSDTGHAIGSLAGLGLEQLQQVAATHAGALMDPGTNHFSQASDALSRAPTRLAVIGRVLGARLQKPALLRGTGRPVSLLGPYETAAQAAAALKVNDVDALLIHAPHLQADWLDAFDATAPGLAMRPKAVLYGFAPDAVCEALAAGGTALLREPQPDAVVAQWLRAWLTLMVARPVPAVPAVRQVAGTETPPRRWEDAALAEFAARSSTVACECPRHVAELLQQLSHFESYSAQCAHRNPADASLHAYLQKVAAASRAQFESGLEHVALHEGLLLPESAPLRE